MDSSHNATCCFGGMSTTFWLQLCPGQELSQEVEMEQGWGSKFQEGEGWHSSLPSFFGPYFLTQSFFFCTLFCCFKSFGAWMKGDDCYKMLEVVLIQWICAQNLEQRSLCIALNAHLHFLGLWAYTSKRIGNQIPIKQPSDFQVKMILG